jgi:hypothetical protein
MGKITFRTLEKHEEVVIARKQYFLLNGSVPAVLEVCYAKERNDWQRAIILEVTLSRPFHKHEEMSQSENEVIHILWENNPLKGTLESCRPFKFKDHRFSETYFFKKEDEEKWDKDIEVYMKFGDKLQPHDVMLILMSQGMGVKEVDPPEEEKYKNK